MKKTYDRLATGERLRYKRSSLGFTQDDVAEKIDRSPKYYADIERGNCGMSIETMIALSESLDLSLDYILFGTDASSQDEENHSSEYDAILKMLRHISKKNQNRAMQLLRLFLISCSNLYEEDENEEVSKQ